MNSLFTILIAMPSSFKRAILIIADSLIVIFALWLSFSLRFGNWYWPIGGVNDSIALLMMIAPALAVPVFIQFGLYRAIIRYLDMKAFLSVFKAVIIYAAVWGLLAFLSGEQGIPRSVVPINAMVALFTIGGLRILARWSLRKIEDANRAKKNHFQQARSLIKQGKANMIIFGAGEAGRQLAVGLEQSHECILLAFVDDNVNLHGRDLMGVPILSESNLVEFVNQHQVDGILLAIPSISRKQRSLIIERLRPLNKHIRTLPGLSDMARGQSVYSQLNELDINDLLTRESAVADEALLQSQVTDQVVLVTGAGGSIGSELCRQILQRKPKTLLLFDISELALYTLNNELKKILNQLSQADSTWFPSEKSQEQDSEKNSGNINLMPRIISLLGSVTDEKRVSDVISTWRPNIIYHAAAVKHVPMVEQNITECVKTNIFGTLVMAKVAIEWQVDSFILISTDKAVNPTNAMGASKRFCELILQALAAEESPSFQILFGGQPSERVDCKMQLAIVRFGNVLGSSGSVVPYFRNQMMQGGPITLTHMDVTRYFMTIQEAAQLVMQAGAMAVQELRDSINEMGAEVYVLDMGEPVKIYDLARRMVELSGLRVKDDDFPSGDIAIKVIGLRPGEKLYEELLIGNNPKKTQHPRIMKANEQYLSWDELTPWLSSLREAADNSDVLMIRTLFKNLIPEYIPEKKVADWVYNEQLKK
ncbi:MAG: polysaccharide biosynthesis protein [Gammaproteobacteria bacterium]|nr:polysaccharide biosynthesis protein [Gammaproteobacteria bacterium]